MSRDLIEEAREAVERAKLVVESARAALERVQRTRHEIESARRARAPYGRRANHERPDSGEVGLVTSNAPRIGVLPD